MSFTVAFQLITIKVMETAYKKEKGLYRKVEEYISFLRTKPSATDQLQRARKG